MKASPSRNIGWLPAAAIVRIPLLALALMLVSPIAPAEEMPVYKLVARDGTFEPKTIEVPAGQRFKIEISNEGKQPVEFESRDLKQEKVLAGGAQSSIVINRLKPGTYVFFDDYRPSNKGQIVAK